MYFAGYPVSDLSEYPTKSLYGATLFQKLEPVTMMAWAGPDEVFVNAPEIVDIWLVHLFEKNRVLCPYFGRPALTSSF